MTRSELQAAMLEELANLAPETEGMPLADDIDLREALDLDSMDILNLLIALSKRLGIDIPDADAKNLLTLAGGTAYLEHRLAGQRRTEKDDG